jgi:glycosyltransferase involved in cell wall biosynthesis
MSLRVLAFTFGGPETASTFYRVAQYVEILRRDHGIELTMHRADELATAPDLREFDRILLQKKLLGSGERRAVFGAGPPVLYDIDDAIWEPHRREHSWLTRWRTNHRLGAIARRASLCLVSNEHLAQGLRRHSSKVAVLPMALDESIWTRRESSDPHTIRLGWAGAPGNLHYLEALEPALEPILQEFPNARVVVFSGARPKFRRINCEYVPYESGGEAAAVRRFDVGLLPLPRDRFAAGKSPIKALQYMASGVPTIADAVAGTEEIFREGGALLAADPLDWEIHLRALVDSAAERARLGETARSRFEAQHALSVTARQLARHLAEPPAA